MALLSLPTDTATQQIHKKRGPQGPPVEAGEQRTVEIEDLSDQVTDSHVSSEGLW